MSIEELAPGEDQQAEVSLQDALESTFDDITESGIDSDDRIDAANAEEFIDPEESIIAAGEEVEEVIAAAVEDDPEEVKLDEIDYNEAAPERWPEEIKSAYNDLTPAGKQAMLEGVFKPMQRQYTQKTQEMAQMRKKLDPMMGILNKHNENFKRAGIDPMTALSRQMEWSAHFARVGNVQGAKDLAKAYGQGEGKTGQQDAQAYMTPVEKRQQAELDQMRGQLNGVQRHEQQRHEQAQNQADEAHQSDVRGSIQSFANETRDGELLHPHIEKVSQKMAGLINGGLVDRADEYGQPIPYGQQLGQAYKLACDLDPNIRTARRTQTRKEQVARASAANREVVGKAPGGDTAHIQDERPLAESISDLYDRMDRSAA